MWFWNIFFWVFGVFTCAYYAGETMMVSSQCTYLAILFSPLLLIPLTNASILIAPQLFKPTRLNIAFLGTVNGLSLVVSSILFAVLSPLCVLACIGMAIGIAQLFVCPQLFGFCAFYFCVAVGPLVTSIAMRRKLHKFLAPGTKGPWLPAMPCFAAVLSLLLISLFPTALTQTCQAAVNSGTKVKEGLLLLRAVGSEDEILRSCYNETVALPWFFFGGHGLFDSSSDSQPSVAARELYYRMKGKPFNSAPRPLGTDPYYWDDYSYYRYLDYTTDFAGESVGGVVHGLRLTQSELRGSVNPDAAFAKLHWKMHFNNSESTGTELRAQILLPPHAVVSGASLWIDGKECKAVFATRESSRKVYAEAAHEGHRPLMVSTAGPGRVLLQSATGWWGKDADLVVEITSPLQLLDNKSAALPLPSFAERNFSVATNHKITLTSAEKNSSIQSSFLKSGADGNSHGLIPNERLASGLAVSFSRNPSAAQFITANDADTKTDIIERLIQTKVGAADTPLIFVIDGSGSMASSIAELGAALAKVQSSDASVVWASDKPVQVIAHAKTSSPEWLAAADRIADSSCLGGQDNAEAITYAINKVKQGSKAAANIVWLHGPQPVEFAGRALLETLDKAGEKTKLYEYQVAPGPNEVVKELDESSSIIQVPHVRSSISEDLAVLSAQLTGKQDVYAMQNSLVSRGSVTAPQVEDGEALAQLYYADQVSLSLAKPELRQKFGALAEKHHLVTPLTSAVVLDSQAQIAQLEHHVDPATKNQNTPAQSGFGLDGLTGGMIPATPEPPMSMIMLCVLMTGMCFVWIRRRRRATV